MKKLLASISIVLLCISTFGIASANSFKIEEVEVIEKDIIELVFTRELSTNLDAVREFIIEKSDTMQEIEVLLSEVDSSNPTRLTLMLSDFLEENTNYTITILDISDTEGNTIEAGVDSIFTFNAGVLTIGSQNQVTRTEENIQEEQIVDEGLTVVDEYEDESLMDDFLENLNAAAEITDNSDGLAGTTLNTSDVASTLTHAENNEALPDTGPEIILLTLLTLLLAGGLMYVRQQKIS